MATAHTHSLGVDACERVFPSGRYFLRFLDTGSGKNNGHHTSQPRSRIAAPWAPSINVGHKPQIDFARMAVYFSRAFGTHKFMPQH